jgi:Ca2+-binding RTX toxin-like protein
MAFVKSSAQFDWGTFNLNLIYKNSYDWHFSDNVNQSVGNYYYQDSYLLSAYVGTEYSSLLAGYGFRVSSLGKIISGTITAYGESYWNGSELVPYFKIQDISVSAKSFYNAITTSSSSDDISLISSALTKADTFILSDYDDSANGFAGNDTLYGNGGDDTLTGGAGQDYLEGGDGNNTFVFNAVSESANSKIKCDFISDFYHGEDALNLSSIDASTKISGNNSFVFNGTTAFGTSKSGEVYYRQFDNSGSSNDYTLVYIDNDSDAASEAIIKLAGLVALSAGDFYL